MSEDAKTIVALSKVFSQMLELLGEDIHREGLLETPTRIASMFLEMTKGLREPPPKMTYFSSAGMDQMVTVLDLSYTSLCEHHFAPFRGCVHIGYIPDKKLAGLSKFGRVVDWFAQRPQIQELMTSQIADRLCEELQPKGLIVVSEGEHMCMSIRGVRKPGHKTVLSAIRGDIDREEFFSLLTATRSHG